MKRILFRLPALAGMAVVVLAGCAGHEQHREGRELMRAGEYDRAVEVLREAVQQDRHNARYLVDLADAEAMAADQNVADARKLLAENRATEAREELRLALDQMPGHPEAIVLMATVEADLRRNSALMEQASAAMGGGRYEEALQLLNAALESDTANPQARHLRAQALARGAIDRPSDALAAGALPAPQADVLSPPAADAVTAPPGRSAPPPGSGATPVAATPPPPALVRNGPPPASDVAVQPGQRPATQPAPVVAAEIAATSTIDDRPAARVTERRQERQERTTPPPRFQPMVERIQGTLSRREKPYPRELAVGDGIRLKLQKTRKNPLAVDVEVRVDRFKKKYKRLRIGSRIYGRGQSRQPYQIVILGINDARKTLHFALEPLTSRPQ